MSIKEVTATPPQAGWAAVLSELEQLRDELVARRALRTRQPDACGWRGENAPSGHNFLRLIWAADRRRENALIQAAAATNPDGAEARIAAYHELVAALGLADGQEMAQPAAAELMAEGADERLERGFASWAEWGREAGGFTNSLDY